MEQPLTEVPSTLLLGILDLELFASDTGGHFFFVHMLAANREPTFPWMLDCGKAYVTVLFLLASPVEALNAIIIWQTMTKAHNYTEKLDCEKHMPATKLSLIHSPSRESQTV